MSNFRSLGQENPLEKGMATHCSIPAWRIPMNRGAWQATVHGVLRVRYDWAANAFTFMFKFIRSFQTLFFQSGLPFYIPFSKVRDLQFVYLTASSIFTILKKFWPHPEACGILVPQLGIKPMPLALKGRVSTTELPGSPHFHYYFL